MIIAAVASGAVAAVSMPVYADSAADGTTAQSPGLISGNTIQLPVHVPVNVCGNTVNVIGLLNSAAGNSCANEGGDSKGGGHKGSAGAVATGVEKESPGLISGNGVHLPVHLPVNVTGNAVSVVGIANPTVGNESTNTSGEPQRRATSSTRRSAPPSKQPAKPADPVEAARPEAAKFVPQGDAEATLAHTGSDPMGPMIAASAALMLGGAVLYRRSRSAAVQRS
ncbi:chaplin [Streptomyces sp. NPDC048484]|uniref:chaplin n=1 Tax=Streptomyces sp. NPDC048484 TaxID=3155146 RepID=UPI0034301DC7